MTEINGNNNISNLAWCTQKENRIHAIKNGLKKEINYGINQYDLQGNLLNTYDTCREALKALGKNDRHSGDLGRAVRGLRKTAYGYVWKPKD